MRELGLKSIVRMKKYHSYRGTVEKIAPNVLNGDLMQQNRMRSGLRILISGMLDQALKRKTNEDTLLLHSDQGWHYQMPQYQRVLKERGITQSMSRKGNCYDNAVMSKLKGMSPVLYRTHALKIA